MSFQRAAVAAALGLAGLLAAPAAAQAEEAVRFRFEAPSDCPAADVFTARVRERTARGREAGAGELARTFTVSITADARGFLGKIEFLDDGGARVHRRLHGEECDAVVSSLALITALALDASLRDDPRHVPPHDQPAELEPPPPRSPAPAAPSRAPVVAAVSSPPPRSRPLVQNVRVGAVAGYHSLIPAPAFGLLGQLDFRGDVSVRVRAHLEQTKVEVDAGRSVSVRLLALSASGCAIRPHWGPFAVYPCLMVDVGSLRAGAIDSAAFRSTSSGTVPWVAVGPELRVAWEPSSPYWLELSGRAPLALYRHRFELESPRRVVLDIDHDPSFDAAIAAGIRFW